MSVRDVTRIDPLSCIFYKPINHLAGHCVPNSPQISVLIPVFNRRDLVVDAVKSALAQRVDGLEVVVIDNHSTDGTWEYLQSLSDPRLKILRNEENIGLFGNFNRCAEYATGDYALFLCSDDRIEDGFLAKAVVAMQSDPGAVLLSSRGRKLHIATNEAQVIAAHIPAGRYAGASVVPAWFWIRHNYMDNPLNYPSGVLLRASALRAMRGFRAELGAPADIDLFLRILRTGHLIVSEDIGCTVLMHEDAESDRIRKSGNLVFDNIALIEAYRPELEAAGLYASVLRQMACLVGVTILRAARVNNAHAIALYRRFDRSAGQMAIAMIRCAAFRLTRSLFAIRWMPFLESLPKP